MEDSWSGVVSLMAQRYFKPRFTQIDSPRITEDYPINILFYCTKRIEWNWWDQALYGNKYLFEAIYCISI